MGAITVSVLKDSKGAPCIDVDVLMEDMTPKQARKLYEQLGKKLDRAIVKVEKMMAKSCK